MCIHGNVDDVIIEMVYKESDSLSNTRILQK